MALKIRVKEMKVGDKKKWYGRTVKGENIDLKRIAGAISQKSTFTEGDIYGVLRSMINEMKFFMQMGYTVRLDDLGSFHLSIVSELVDDKEDYRVDQHVKGVRCRFRPTAHRKGTGGKLLYDFCDGVELEKE